MDNTTQLTIEEARAQLETRYGQNMFNLWLARLKCPAKALEVALLATGDEKGYQVFVKVSGWAT